MSDTNRTYVEKQDRETNKTRVCLYENGELKGSFNVGALSVNIKTGKISPAQKKANQKAIKAYNQQIKNWIDNGIVPK